MFSFKPLWKQLIDKDIKKTQLQEKAKFSSRTLATMNKNEYISMDVLDRICNTLDCNIENVIEHKKDNKEENE